jgi:anti-anti-sigma regulatory factor
VPEALRYKEKDGVLYIRAEGHVTAALCADLRFMIFERFDAEPKVKGMYVDLSECTYMDSTFIGFIVSLERLSESSKLDTLIVLRPSIQCRSAMKKLSVLPHLSLSNDGTPDIPVFALEKDPAAFKRKKNVALMFEAHKTLSDLNEENRKEFSALLEELEKVLEKNNHVE